MGKESSTLLQDLTKRRKEISKKIGRREITVVE